MTKRWSRTILIFVLAGLSGTLLLQTSQKVQHAEDEMRRLQHAIESERETIRVLRAEWAYLNRPENLEALAASYLDLVPSDPAQMIATPSTLPDTLVPILPPTKPLYQQISHQSPVSVPVPPAAVFKSSVVKPKTKPRRARDNFNDLLGKLEQEDGE